MAQVFILTGALEPLLASQLMHSDPADANYEVTKVS
jgi:hypothetical protein